MNPQIDESSLLFRVKHSDADAFEILFQKYFPILFRSLWYRTGDEALAKDLAQETFFKAWLYRERIKPELAFYGYLERIGKNLLLDHVKHEDVKHRHRDHVAALGQKPGNGPEQRLRAKDLEEKIRTVVNGKLAAKCRTIFVLSRVEGLSNAEIAALLKISKKTVENQLYSALKHLRKHCAEFL